MNISDPKKASQAYTLELGRRHVSVDPSCLAEAKGLDTNHDHFLENKELLLGLGFDSTGKALRKHEKGQAAPLLVQLKGHLTHTPNPKASKYHSYDQAAQEMEDLAEKFPHLAQRVSLGKTYEGRDIWALKISEGVDKQDTSLRPGVVVTGLHHAREWMTAEAPLQLAHDMLENYAHDSADRKRVDQAETWIVPIVNPDGLEYSRNVDPAWRKNRVPVEGTVDGQLHKSIGVDLNRNYYDGNTDHLELYRPASDKPGVTSDDFGATSDDPASDSYRGPSGASESEIKSLLGLELGHKNIRGVIDLHSYGDNILYPSSHTKDEVPNAPLYKDVAKQMNAAMGNSMVVEQSIGLYPTSGGSDDCLDANGILCYTLEVGKSFQPAPETIKPTSERVAKGTEAFIDQIVDRSQAETLPLRA